MDAATWMQDIEARVQERVAPAGARSPRALTVLFDPACALCRRCRDWMLGQAAYVPLVFIPCTGAEARARYGEIPWLGDEIVVVGDGGEVWAGPAAFFTSVGARRLARVVIPARRSGVRAARRPVLPHGLQQSPWHRRAPRPRLRGRSCPRWCASALTVEFRLRTRPAPDDFRARSTSARVYGMRGSLATASPPASFVSAARHAGLRIAVRQWVFVCVRRGAAATRETRGARQVHDQQRGARDRPGAGGDASVSIFPGGDGGRGQYQNDMGISREIGIWSSLAFGTLYTSSAIWGFNTVSHCREVKDVEEQEAEEDAARARRAAKQAAAAAAAAKAAGDAAAAGGSAASKAAGQPAAPAPTAP